MGKLLLLVALAMRIEAGELDVHVPLSRRSVPPVADSGLWQHLLVDALPVDDLAVLVGTVSELIPPRPVGHVASPSSSAAGRRSRPTNIASAAVPARCTTSMVPVRPTREAAHPKATCRGTRPSSE
jgi:hypothetical protein